MQKKFQETQIPIPYETNELDWKSQISVNKERLLEHLIACSNLSNGGYLVLGTKGDQSNQEKSLLFLQP